MTENDLSPAVLSFVIGIWSLMPWLLLVKRSGLMTCHYCKSGTAPCTAIIILLTLKCYIYCYRYELQTFIFKQKEQRIPKHINQQLGEYYEMWGYLWNSTWPPQKLSSFKCSTDQWFVKCILYDSIYFKSYDVWYKYKTLNVKNQLSCNRDFITIGRTWTQSSCNQNNTFGQSSQ